MQNDRIMAQSVAQKVREAGGTAYFVGGCVRDALLGQEAKDIDIEVHGIPVQTLSAILDSLGEKMTVGVNFGVFTMRHTNLDIAMPRTEQATGRGHRDFAVFVDPFIGAEKAAKRRDFTINAMMQNVLTGEILDYYGGKNDLAAGILRHVNDASFAEDPLRVLRAAQFASRFGFTVAPETMRLCSTMDLSFLAGERVLGETDKALMKADKPSTYFEILRDMGQLSTWFPEVEALIGVQQDKTHHPEGDAFTHTMLVLDAAASLRDEAEYPEGLMPAALCHDFGKPLCTTVGNDGHIHSYGHETHSERLSRVFMNRMMHEVKRAKYVSNLVYLHMRPNLLVSQQSGKKAFMKLYDAAISPKDLVLLSKCDQMGQLKDPTKNQETLRYMLSEFENLKQTKQVSGADLIEAGYKPGSLFGKAIAHAHDLWLSGMPYDEAKANTLAFMQREKKNV